MGPALLIGIILLPLVEIALFIAVGGAIGLLPTLLLVVVAALAGGLILRWQGISAINDMRRTMGAGRLPARALADTMLLGFAGMLLFLPGFFTDIIALALLIPAVRTALYRFLGRRMKVVVATSDGTTTTSYRSRDSDRIGSQETIELDDEDWRPRP
jgi:UPF0716 protein FxsA